MTGDDPSISRHSLHSALTTSAVLCLAAVHTNRVVHTRPSSSTAMCCPAHSLADSERAVPMLIATLIIHIH